MFASVGDRGGTSAKALGQTISLSPSSSVTAGNLLAVFVAWDNNNASTGDGPLSTQIECTDSVGNIYREMYSGQATGATARAHGCIFLTVADTAIGTGDTVTVRNTTSSKVAKAVSMWEFSIDAGALIATTAHGPQQVLTNGADPAAISISSLQSREYLLLHVLAAEGPSTDTYTWDPDYTQITSFGTTGGIADTNMTVNGGFRIATLTSDTVDIGATAPFRDYTQGLQAVWGYTPTIPTFPTTPILDDFSRADIDPLPTPPWKGTGANNGTRLLRNFSGTAMRGEASGTGSGGGDWWGDLFMGNDQEAYVTIAASPGGQGNHWGVMVVGDGDHGSLRSGNGFTIWQVGTVEDVLAFGQLGIVTTPSPAWGLAWVSFSVGNSFGMRRIGDLHQHYINRGSGWYHIQTVDTDTGIASQGYIGLTTTLNVGRADDFGGGLILARGRSYIYIID